MYLLLEHQDIHDVMISDDELVEVKSSSSCSSRKDENIDNNKPIPPPCTKRQRLEDGEPRRIRFVPDEDNLFHEIPTRQELYEEHGVEWDQLFYQPEDLRELKRQAYLEVRIVELTCREDECTEDYFFHEIVVVDSEELQRLRIFLNGTPPPTSSSLTCCLRGLEKRSSRFTAAGSNKSKSNKKVRAKSLATVLMGQEKLQQQRTAGSWRNWLNPTAQETTVTDDVDDQMDLVAQLYKDVTMPSVEAAQQRAAYDELEAKAIYSSSGVVAQ